MRILIADDHALIRKGLRRLLAEALPQVEFGEASNAQEALDLVWGNHWNVLLLDITMPGRSGLDLLKQLKQDRPELPVLVLSAHPKMITHCACSKPARPASSTRTPPSKSYSPRSERLLPAASTSAPQSERLWRNPWKLLRRTHVTRISRTANSRSFVCLRRARPSARSRRNC